MKAGRKLCEVSGGGGLVPVGASICSSNFVSGRSVGSLFVSGRGGV